MERKIRILHIDDNLHDRQLVKDVLQKESGGFEVTEADSREKFEKYLAEEEFDLVLSDFNILGFDGLQVLQVVHEKEPELPVIIVTGTGSEEIAIEAMKMGAADYVIKSYKHIQGLVPRIRAVLDFKKIQDEHKMALIALHENEELFRTAFESAVVGVCMLSPGGQFLSVNNTLCQMLGYSGEELIQLNIGDITHPEDVVHSNEMLADLLAGQLNRVIIEKRYLHHRGQILWVNVSIGIVRRTRDYSPYFVAYIQDITERKKSEEQLIVAKEKAEESDRLKTAFLHNISHEIRTPMNAIVGFSSFLDDPDLNADKRKEYTGIIIDSSQQLLSIITDIVSIATIEAGQVKMHSREVNINSLLNQLAGLYSAKAEMKGISLRMMPGCEDAEASVVTDDSKLTEVLGNLTDNAIKFTRQGQVTVGYEVRGDYMEFFIRDTGIGIPHHLQGEIFKRFRQAEITATRQFGGSGLGLSISKAYVEMLGGNIWLTSEPGKGSDFFFTLPVVKASQGKAEVESASMAKSRLDKNITLLIAEDEANNFFLLEQFLSKFEVNIIRAENGLQAVEICRSNEPIDLVLMDIKMPEMNGHEATKLIKEIRPGLPVICQTAYASDLDDESARAHGYVDVLSKPFSQKMLIDKIIQHLPA